MRITPFSRNITGTSSSPGHCRAPIRLTNILVSSQIISISYDYAFKNPLQSEVALHSMVGPMSFNDQPQSLAIIIYL